MTYRNTMILLPCHSLEDFPMHCDGPDADGLLAAWTALWHPGLLAASGSAPNWHHAAYPPEDLSGSLILIPEASRSELADGFLEQARDADADVIIGNFTRAEIMAQAGSGVGPALDAGSPELVDDFFALGYCYLQVELLTRQMRYATNLDEVQFYRLAVEGASAWNADDVDQAREKLVACFDLLAQERDHYYAVDAYLLDLLLVAPSTLGAPLAKILADEVPINLFVTGDLIRQIQRESPDSLKQLHDGVAQGRIGLIGGEQIEGPAPLLSCESLLANLQRGKQSFERIVRARAHVFGRRRFGMTPLHPQLLGRMGYSGALHATADGGRFPEGTQAKLRWEGSDLSTLDTVARIPLDAARGETFLGFAGKLGESMDMDHIATICLLHWPGQESPWYHDLRRAARYGGILGKFVTVDDYFRDSDYPTQLERFQADHYYSPYLKQAVIGDHADAISRFVRYWRRRTQLDAARALLTAASLVAGLRRSELDTVDDLVLQTDQVIDTLQDSGLDRGLDSKIDQVWDTAVEHLAGQVRRTEGPDVVGTMVLNPYSTVRRTSADWSQLASLPVVEKPVYAAVRDADRQFGVVDVPPMGFVWVQGGSATKAGPTTDQVLAEPNRLFNEFFEAHIDPVTGALRAVYTYDTRGNRLSQQVALRMGRGGRGAGPHAGYSIMAADSVQITANTPAMAEITVAGRMVMRNGDTVATYRQQFQVWRGTRILHLGIEIEPHVLPADDPWDSYYASRFAWPSEAALVWRGVNQQRHRGEAKRLEAPLYIDLDDGKHHTTVLTGGLPFHRRCGPRMLDSLLIVRGEQARRFELAVGFDVKYPLQEAQALMCPLPSITQTAPEPRGTHSSWLFHLDCRNVVATYWDPLLEEGQLAGFRTRLLETMGRPANVNLSCFRPIRVACQRDFVGESRGDLQVHDGALQVNIDANQWLEIEARW